MIRHGEAAGHVTRCLACCDVEGWDDRFDYCRCCGREAPRFSAQRAREDDEASTRPLPTVRSPELRKGWHALRRLVLRAFHAGQAR